MDDEAQALRIFDHLFDDPKMVACIAAGIEIDYLFYYCITTRRTPPFGYPEIRDGGIRIAATAVSRTVS